MKTTYLSERILAGMLGVAICGGGAVAAQNAGAGAAPAAAANCAVSKPVDVKGAGSGPHQVVIEYNCSPGISTGTIYRPADMKGAKKYPILVWGEGGCSQNGLSNQAAMSEIASHGYFVVADGTPTAEGRGQSPGMGNGDMTAQGKPLIGYIDWAIAENGRSTSPYFNSLDTTKIASNGFSCGGLMAIGTVGDKRITTWGVTSSGMKRVNEDFYKLVRTPVLFIEGGPGDTAYEGGQMGYAAISKLGVPVMWFDKAIGHGGDLSKPNGGDFTRIHLAWLNWQLKGDTSVTGKGLLIGPDCTYCKDTSWDVKSANIK
jgi:hypothetical protein